MKKEKFKRITEVAHQMLAGRIEPGDKVLDATAGNGHDTLFLAEKVGETGKVYACDIQEEAIQHTRERLHAHGMEQRVELHLMSHADVPEEWGPLAAAVFNLGYLPGSDETVITRGETTLIAVKKILSLLSNGGMLLLVFYVGHEGGKKEAEELEVFIGNLPFKEYMVLKYQYINPANDPPYIVAIEKKG